MNRQLNEPGGRSASRENSEKPSYMRAPTTSPRTIRFGPFIANLRSGELHKGETKLKLQEQPFKILAVLLAQAGEVVTRDDLRKRLWPDNTYIDFDHGINMAIGKIREVLGDSADEPRFVETLGRRGYRFIAAVEASSDEAVPTVAHERVLQSKRHSVGREKERTELTVAFESVTDGCGELVCVAGEPGIGKTTLVQDFLSDLQFSGKSFGLAVGRCSQRLAGEEAYLPFLEALESLLRGGGGAARKLRASAPSWYAQLIPLSKSDPSDARLQEYLRTTTQERVKRELAAFFYEVTREEPLILFFDDMHWADPSTVDLLAHLATKFDSTRVMVVVTYRPSELFLLKHPFIQVKRDLQARGLCRDIGVEFLSLEDVGQYIALEFSGNIFPREFAGLVHSRTEGNPLFMVDLLRYLRSRGVILKTEADASWRLARSQPDLSRNFPQSVSNVIDRKIEQLSDRDREVLTSAAVQGYEFDSTAVARALETGSIEIEEALDRLDRIHEFVKRMGDSEHIGGAPTVRYRFVHVLYQNALYASLTPARRVVMSAALARALEALNGGQRPNIASQLAFLYETARDPQRASDYFRLAAANAQRIFANQEAVALARRGLALLDKMPDTPERTQKEFDLQVTLAFSLLFTRGYGVQEVQENMARARELCHRLGDQAQLFPVLFGLWVYYITAPELQACRQTAEHLLGIARGAKDPVLLVMAHATLGIVLQHQGEIASGHKELDEAFSYYDPSQHRHYAALYRMDPGINARAQSVRTIWMLGYSDQACRRSEEAVALARTTPSPPSLAYALMHSTFLHQHLRQPEKARELGEECIRVCDEHGISQERAWVMFAHGWALAETGEVEEGISEIRGALEAQLSTGGQIARPMFLAFLVEVYLPECRKA